MADIGDIYELEQLAVQPGTYVNPQTEVVIVVEDSAAVDQEVFEEEATEGTEWVRVSDEVPVDETLLEEALEEFHARRHPGAASQAIKSVPRVSSLRNLRRAESAPFA